MAVVQQDRTGVCVGITAKPLDQKGPKLAYGFQVIGLVLITACGCGNGCGFFIAMPTGSCFGCQKLIKDISGQNLACDLQVPGLAFLATLGVLLS